MSSLTKFVVAAVCAQTQETYGGTAVTDTNGKFTIMISGDAVTHSCLKFNQDAVKMQDGCNVIENKLVCLLPKGTTEFLATGTNEIQTILFECFENTTKGTNS